MIGLESEYRIVGDVLTDIHLATECSPGYHQRRASSGLHVGWDGIGAAYDLWRGLKSCRNALNALACDGHFVGCP